MVALSGKNFYICFGKCLFYSFVFTVIANNHNIWIKLQCLFDQELFICMRSKNFNRKFIRVCSNYIQGLRTD